MEPIAAHLASKFAESATTIYKLFMCIKHAQFQADFESLENKSKTFTQK
jgi:hypothetical protein